tara:strand:+ start:3719 stop:5125 length:1407 start_codon:yes stop_codon:yes gene_type:complete
MESLNKANRGSVSTGPYQVDNSLKVEADNNELLSRSTSGASDGSSTQHTISVWVKRTELGIDCEPVSAAGIGRFRFESDDTFSYQFRSGKEIITTRKFRDTSAWYHIVAVGDSSQSTASDRMKLYVNGVQETDFGTANYQDQNQASPGWGKNTLYSLNVGAAASSTRNFSGYIAEMYYIDGQSLDPTYFGEFDDDTGIWIPKAFTGTHGSLDTYLDFSDSSNLGKNSGGTTDLTATNIAAADQATDSPTNNFCTWAPQWGFYRKSTITEGGTEVAGAAGGWSHAASSFGVSNGRWYWEWKITSSEIGFISISTLEGNLGLNQLGHDNSVIMGYANGNLYTWLGGSQGSNESTGWGTWAVNDIIGIYLDLENSDRRFVLYKNGSAISGSTSFPVSLPNQMQVANGGGAIFPYNVQYENDGGEWNFGGYTTMTNSKSHTDANGYGNFVYDPTLSGVEYYALCTKNLAEFG